ncbi:hypothetical protein OG711_07935 [Streptomyces uncialis]|uniref:hypothetical protein n=1 Tax=Streptomyces uncialis TaxID=1048205 RepID=UPI002E2EB408|nr:hypothetical protein [Streptomyces uncialis]
MHEELTELVPRLFGNGIVQGAGSAVVSRDSGAALLLVLDDCAGAGQCPFDRLDTPVLEGLVVGGQELVGDRLSGGAAVRVGAVELVRQRLQVQAEEVFAGASVGLRL